MAALLRIQPGSWTRQAACANHPDLDWFTDQRTEIAACKAICATCPVKTDCLTHAIDAGETHGIWGGLRHTERDGRRAPTPIAHGTPAGYQAHRRRFEPACPACRRANADASAERKAQRATA